MLFRSKGSKKMVWEYMEDWVNKDRKRVAGLMVRYYSNKLGAKTAKSPVPDNLKANVGVVSKPMDQPAK